MKMLQYLFMLLLQIKAITLLHEWNMLPFNIKSSNIDIVKNS